MSDIRKKSRLAILLMSASALALPALAQESAAEDGEESRRTLQAVTVTAERTEGTIQTTPIAVTAINGDALTDRGIATLEGLSGAIPNLTFGNQLGTPNVSIRGIGLSTLSTGQESNIAYNVDGVYLGRPAAAQGAFYDLERVEVLRGPQGTLYGRNATGGSINVITKRPTDELEGYVNLSYGEFNRFEALGALSGPLGDRVRARVATRYVNRDGFGTNVTTGNDLFDEETFSVRGTLEFDIADDWLLSVSGDYYTQDDSAIGYSFVQPGNPGVTPLAIVPADQPGLFGGLGGSTGGGGTIFQGDNVFDNSFDVDPTNERDYFGFLAHLEGKIGSVNFNSRTSYRSTDYEITSDIDGSDVFFADIAQSEFADQFSQEFVFDGNLFGDRLDWVFGLYYFHEDIDGNTVVNQPFNFPAFTGGVGNVFIASGNLQTDAFAVFGNGRFGITDDLSFVFGLRYSIEEKELDNFGQVTAFGPPVTGVFDEMFDAFTPRFALEYDATDDLFLYASATRGFKSGGFDLGTQNPDPSFDEEFIWNYEIGSKFSFPNNLGTFNLTGFYADYEDLQVGQITGLTLVIENAAQATVGGIEAELTFTPTKDLTLYTNATYLNAEFDDFVTDDAVTGAVGLDLSGNSLPQAPQFTAQFGGTYTHDLSFGGYLTFEANARYTDEQFFSAFNRADGIEQQDGYFRADLLLGYTSESERYSVNVYARNLGENDVLTNSFVSSFLFGFPEFGFFAPPQQFGVSLSTRF